ncbi:orange carotenoid protein N-terminal domain-containing protein [Candidatus Cyanaurora vandensis]|uniref:orange carotenoid protein N-terminal domain-containing protein n=1 Tax=Candidatus Cyanaurora vandensis TaxID=2714958 RepID=UPI00257E3441|nr:orange carotenoid protein N-terminal domain-containing protein [Candidatus Cyanaurora vandensis]
MTQSTDPVKSQQEISAMVEQAYDRGVEHPRDQAYDTDASTTTAPATGSGVSSQEISDIVDQLMNDVPPEQIRSEDVRSSDNQFDGLSVDDKLAVFYFLYREMGESVTPAALGAANTELASGFFTEFNSLAKGDDQLEAQRAIVRGDDIPLSRAYSSQTENNKLAIWYLIAQRMGGDVTGVPEGYELTDAGNKSFEAVKNLDFEQQITFFRDIANRMGSSPVEPNEPSGIAQRG